jgi:hypothetical protein
MPRIGVAALVLFSLAGRAGAAWECRTTHFRVISELGPESASAAAKRLEAVKRRFEELGLTRPAEVRGPVLVLVFADGRSLHPSSTGTWPRAVTREASWWRSFSKPATMSVRTKNTELADCLLPAQPNTRRKQPRAGRW